MAAVKLHYLRPSHYCEKARAILAFKGIKHKVVNVPYNDHTKLLKLSGQDYTPYLEIGGGKGVVWQDIAEWAENEAPQPTLYPGDAAATRATSHIIEAWAHGMVEEAVWKYVVPDAPAKFKDPSERWIFEEFQERKRGPLDSMRDRRPEFLVGVQEVLGLAEGVLGDKDFLLADAPSLADFALFGALHPFAFTGLAWPEGFDGLQPWHSRVSDLVGPAPL